MPRNLWDNSQGNNLTGLGELVYRSNLLGTDRTVCNFGGGNTSSKTTETDFRGRQVSTMWVKGSGSDLATATSKSFTALNLDDVLPLFTRESMTDEEMVAYLTRCMQDPSHPRMSIETLLHAFLPFKHVDHTHPDAIISICTSSNGKEIAKKIWGDKFVWVPYIRPGFTLSQMIAQGVKDNPNAELVLMEKHGLVTWGETSAQTYLKTLEVIGQAEEYLQSSITANGQRLFGGAKYSSLGKEKRGLIAAQIMPLLRSSGDAESSKGMILNFDDSEDVLRFVNSEDCDKLGKIGAACPDHLVHTKRTPMFIEWDPSSGDINALELLTRNSFEEYCQQYKTYFENNKGESDSMVAPAPRIILIPGVGMVTTGKTKTMAKIAADLYHRAIAVMTGATSTGDFVSLSAAESFAIEYWPLELYKLSLAPPEAEFSRKVALITGGGGGIGGATAHALAKSGAHVVIADIRKEAAQGTATTINSAFGDGRASAITMDVTREESVIDAFMEACLEYGGVDILVNNAGLASSSSFAETTLDDWNRNQAVLSTGYFLVAREAFKLMQKQGSGGAMVFVGSKNSVYAGKNAAAYSTAKAAELHLARCIAAEGGDYGIRVNTVLPDAVLQGSAIWNSSWRAERAAAYNIQPHELEEYYRKRTVLGVNVTPNDIAETIAFLASSKSAKTTGCAITVDGGVAAAFVR